MSGAKAKHQREQQRTADLQRRVDDLENEAAALRAENDALRFRLPEATAAVTRRIVHDLNNLLQTIMGKAELVLDEASVPDRTRDLWQAILDAAVGSAALTQQLLALSKKGEIPDLAVAPATRGVARRADQRSRPAVLPGRILVAEDQRPVRDLARTVLSNAGHQVIVVANGAEAVAAVQESDFDVVLMDIQMPVMDGLSAARKIRQLAGSRSKIPIIAASAAALTGGAESLADAGINDYITKPYTFVTLVRKIDAWLSRSVDQDGAEATTRNEADGGPLLELDDLMGRAWVERGLTSLVAQIDELFAAHGITSILDRERLAGRAHALVSLAGLLGFSDLSQRCSSLEEAARRGRDVLAPLAGVKAAATQARAKAAEVLNLGR